LKDRVYIAVPTPGHIDKEALAGLLAPSTDPELTWSVRPEGHSLLTKTFNDHLCAAMNERSEHGWNKFVLHHSDVECEVGWLDKLRYAYYLSGAQVISAVLPIKDGRGVTSTAKRGKNGNIIRVTMHHLWGTPCLPDIFTIDNFEGNEEGDHLLLNTGLMMFDLNEEWVIPWMLSEGFCQRDRIFQDRDGKFVAACLPEDWGFSVYCDKNKIKTAATKTVKASHLGRFGFPNWRDWGNWQYDEGDSKHKASTLQNTDPIPSSER